MTNARTAVPALLLGLGVLLAACGPSAAGTTPSPAAATPATSPGTGASQLAATPSAAASSSIPAVVATTCTAPATPTIAQTEGPYYRAGAPENAELATADMAGTRLTLTGTVVDTSCTPLAGAKVDIWQADASGAYDNAGYTLRGYVLTDADGRFTIHTIVPGEYPGRTEHIHAKITPAGGQTLTTQLYFPGTAANDADGIYSPDMLLDISPDGDALIGTYTFVIAA
jgi:protocatechuate 3,4-dioxygenase beta subunit